MTETPHHNDPAPAGIETVLPGLYELLAEFGFDSERFRALQPDEQYRYFTFEFLENATKDAERLRDLFLECGANIMVFCAQLWAIHNPDEAFAKKVRAEYARTRKEQRNIVKAAEKASKAEKKSKTKKKGKS